jgi:hypothetical protein
MAEQQKSVTLFESFSFKGLELRDYFAATIVGGILSNSNIKDVTDAELAEIAYGLSDAMMEVRENG